MGGSDPRMGDKACESRGGSLPRGQDSTEMGDWLHTGGIFSLAEREKTRMNPVYY